MALVEAHSCKHLGLMQISPFIAGASLRSIALRFGMVMLTSEGSEQMKKCVRKAKSASSKFKDVVNNSKINCNYQRIFEEFKDFAQNSKNSLNVKTSLIFRKIFAFFWVDLWRTKQFFEFQRFLWIDSKIFWKDKDVWECSNKLNEIWTKSLNY